MLNRLRSDRATPSLDLPCVVCGGALVRWPVGRKALPAVRCTRCGTVRLSPAAASTRSALPKQQHDANRRAVRDRTRANLAVIRDLTRGNRFLDAGGLGGLPAALAVEFGFAPVRLPLFATGTASPDTTFLAPLEREILSDRLYDVVYAHGCLGRAPDPMALTTNLSLLLSPRGLLFVNAPTVEMSGGGVAVARRQRNAFTRGGLVGLLEACGFVVVCECPAAPGLVAYVARLED